MKQPPRQRTIKDERDEKIGKDAKVYAFEWIIAITQVLTIMCIIKGNPAWKGTISILFFCPNSQQICCFFLMISG